MNKKIIAKELYRIAKELIAVEVANQKGEYKNFTGMIEWGRTKGQVENADFELKDGFDIYWSKGI